MSVFLGSLVALATPFAGDSVDEERFAGFADWQVAEGSRGVVPCSVIGEGPTLTRSERARLIRIAVEAADRRVTVIAAAGTHATESTIDHARDARRAEADALLLVTPYDNRPSQEGLFRHFEAVARAVDLPIIVHNDPARTACDLLPATLARLAGLDEIARMH